MTPDIRFFQAAATVIPTLLVAIFFSARAFAMPGPGGRFARLRIMLVFLFGIVLMGGTVLGERAALTVLFTGRPTTTAAFFTRLALYSEGVMLISAGVGAFVRPLHGAIRAMLLVDDPIEWPSPLETKRPHLYRVLIGIDTAMGRIARINAAAATILLSGAFLLLVLTLNVT